MRHLILAAIFFASQLAWGANAPIATKGFADVDYKELRRLQVPHFQITDLGKNVFLMDTGNTNVWQNSAMEALTGSVPTGWAASGGLLNNNTGANAIWGKSLAWLASAGSQTLTGPEMELSNDCFQKNCQVGAWINTNATGMKLRILNSGLSTLFEFDLPNTESQFRYIAFNFVPQTSLVRLRFVSNAVNDQLYLDNGYLGAAKNVYSGSVYIPWTNYTPTISTVSGTLTNYVYDYAQWMRNGENAYIRIRLRFTGSPGTWTSPKFSFPPGMTSASSALFFDAQIIDVGTGAYKAMAHLETTSLITLYSNSAGGGGVVITQSAPFAWANTDIMDVLVGPVKIQEWVGQGQAVMSLNSLPANTPTVNYTPTLNSNTNATVALSEWSKSGDKLFQRNFITYSGAGASSAFTVTTPNLVTVGSGVDVGHCQWFDNGTAFRTGTAVAITSTTIGCYIDNTTGYLQTNSLANGDIVSVIISGIKVYGWTVPTTENPLITNSEANGYAGAVNNIHANINCDASSSITSQSGGISAVGNRSSTSCALTITSGFFSATPFKCTPTINGATVNATSCVCASATSCTIYGPSADYDMWVDISGPR